MRSVGNALRGGLFAWPHGVQPQPGDLDGRLATHEGHLVELSARDRTALDAGAAAMIPAFTLTGPAADVGARVAALADAGVTEVAFQPGGPDIARELRAFADAVAPSPSR